MGALLASSSQRTAALALAAWNVGSGAAEAALLTAVHRANAGALCAPKRPPGNGGAAAPPPGAAARRGGGVYGAQRCARAGLALSMLYLSSLTFGSLMSAFLHARGVSLAAIGRGRAAAAAASLAGAAAFPALRRRLTTRGAARAGVLLQASGWRCCRSVPAGERLVSIIAAC